MATKRKNDVTISKDNFKFIKAVLEKNEADSTAFLKNIVTEKLDALYNKALNETETF